MRTADEGPRTTDNGLQIRNHGRAGIVFADGAAGAAFMVAGGAKNFITHGLTLRPAALAAERFGLGVQCWVHDWE